MDGRSVGARMKLYNKTKCPDELLRPIIMAAGQRIGARTKIVVKVLGPRRGSQGHASPGQPYIWHLTSKRYVGVSRKKLIPSDGGWITLHIPRSHPCCDALMQAEVFYELCLHEWAHIKDMQERKRFGDYERNWANRPHERRAVRMQEEATDKPYSAKAEAGILALAEWLEKQR